MFRQQTRSTRTDPPFPYTTLVRSSDSLKDAMKAKEALATSTLRLILAALKDRDIAERTKGNGEGVGDDAILEMLQKMVRQRHESIEMYTKGGRPDLAK